MLQKNVHLDAKTIRGKRIRLLFCAYIGTIFLIVGLYFGGIALITRARSALSVFLALVVSGGFLIVLDFKSSRIVCILGDEHLSFFHCEVEQRVQSNKRKVREWCDGSISYADIRAIQRVIHHKRTFKRGTRYALVITGTDFRLTILDGDKSLMRKINKKRAALLGCSSYTAALPNFDAMCHQRCGLFMDLWSILESGEHFQRFADGIRVLGLRLDEQENFAELTVAVDGKVFFIFLDADGAALGADETGVLDTLDYSQAASADDFFARWNEVLRKNAGF